MSAGTADFLAGHRDRRIDALTDRLVETIIEQNPGYRSASVVPPADLHRSCRDNIIRVLELLALSMGGDRPVDAEQYLDAAEETGRRRAEQGLPLDDVLRSFRLGGRLIWEDLIEEARAADALDADALREVGTRLWQVVDQTSSHVALAYHATERSLVRADEQRSAAMWEELLGGRAQDPGFARLAAQTFGLPLEGPYLAVALSGSVDDLGPLLARRRIGSAWHLRTDTVVGVLALDGATLSEAVEVLRHGAIARGGVSGQVGDLAEIGTAFAQATLALGTLAPGEAGIVTFEERLVEALLLRSPDVADRLVHTWLGPVLALPDADSRPLLGTLRAWAGSGGSMTRTAQEVSCHRNTAINRIGRVAGLIGFSLGEGTVPVEVTLALRALDLDRLE